MTLSIPWNRQKPREYYEASDFEKVQWSCGIPSRFWNVKLSSIHPSAAKYVLDGQHSPVKASDQLRYLTERVENPELLNSNRFACFTSYPTDEHAMAAACVMASAYIEEAYMATQPVKVRIDDIQDYEQCIGLKKEFYSVAPDVLIIYNLNDNTSRSRLQLVADILKKYEGVYRAVVASHNSPLEFSRDVLKMEPQEVYHFEGRPRKVSSR